MLLMISIILGLALGMVFGGKITSLGELKGLYFPIISFAVTPVISFNPQISLWAKAALITFSYLCIFLFVIENRRHVASVIVLAMGALCNYLVIAANDFRMPVSIGALSAYDNISPEKVIAQRADYFIATDGANLLFLGDVIGVPIPIVGGFISVGDILLAVGMFMLIFAVLYGGKNMNYHKEEILLK